MRQFEVTVFEGSTVTVEVYAEDSNAAIEAASEMVDNGEVTFEPDGSREFDVEEL